MAGVSRTIEGYIIMYSYIMNGLEGYIIMTIITKMHNNRWSVQHFNYFMDFIDPPACTVLKAEDRPVCSLDWNINIFYSEHKKICTLGTGPPIAMLWSSYIIYNYLCRCYTELHATIRYAVAVAVVQTN